MSEPRTGRQPRVGHRRAAVRIVPGKTAQISAEDWAEERAIRAELDDVKRRLSNVTRRLQRQLGDAEYGLVNGRPVVRRVELITGGTYAPVNHRALLEATE
jgi:hypothetical protein